ncbi:hypothetical protein GEV33_012576 [Tenebrio molitor]|uniref:Uncharacterized protein n=1 Tax=Tenebrio molitor TaxID=7067 RepID=A0A8J6LEX9_TENMO|nr:hypothetical protein GEV33_012576 [Tenebrio molitor]
MNVYAASLTLTERLAVRVWCVKPGAHRCRPYLRIIYQIHLFILADEDVRCTDSRGKFAETSPNFLRTSRRKTKKETKKSGGRGTALAGSQLPRLQQAATAITSRPPLCIQQDLKEISDNILGPCFGMTVRTITTGRTEPPHARLSVISSATARWKRRVPVGRAPVHNCRIVKTLAVPSVNRSVDHTEFRRRRRNDRTPPPINLFRSVLKHPEWWLAEMPPYPPGLILFHGKYDFKLGRAADIGPLVGLLGFVGFVVNLLNALKSASEKMHPKKNYFLSAWDGDPPCFVRHPAKNTARSLWSNYYHCAHQPDTSSARVATRSDPIIAPRSLYIFPKHKYKDSRYQSRDNKYSNFNYTICNVISAVEMIQQNVDCGLKSRRQDGKVGRLQEPCEFPESANILSSTSVYINEEFSKPTISVCNQEDKENAGAKESRLQELYEFPESAPTSCLQLPST